MRQRRRMSNVKAYIISFRDDSKRRDVLLKRFNATGLEIVFVDAVNGKHLTPEERAPFDFNNRQFRAAHLLQDNAIGCALSHYKAWTKLIESDEKYAYVFEDDVQFLTDKSSNVFSELDALSANLDIVCLANRRQSLKRFKVADCGQNSDLVVLKGNDFGAEGYFISKHAAQTLLAHPHRHEYEVDFLIHHWWRHNCSVLHIMPPICSEDGRTSSIGYQNVPVWENDKTKHLVARRFNRLKDSLNKRLLFRQRINSVKTKFS